MNRLTALLLVASLQSGSLFAQTVVAPDPPLDATRAKAREALLVLRDSLASVDAAVARLERDLGSSSDVAARSRATRVGEACARGSRTLTGARTTVSGLAVPSPDPTRQRAALEGAMTSLQGTLDRCTADFRNLAAPGKISELRSTAVITGLKVESEIRKYEGKLQSYFAAAKIQVRPLGAGRSPLAS